MSDSLRVRAPAKVNLFLRVLARREDGFHDLETLFQAIDLCDVVGVGLAGEGVELDVRGPEPCPSEDNLALRAADEFRRRFSLESGVRVRLEKRIPAGAGLGGGSSDAAAVLRCLAALSGVELGSPGLLDLAAELGSDVPFFLGRSALAFGTGRGEVLEPLSPLPPLWVVLSTPPVHVSTGAAFESLSRPPADRAHSVSTAKTVLTTWDQVLLQVGNDFQDVVAAAHSSVATSLTALERVGASGVSLSGSGAASFGLFDSGSKAKEAADRLSEELGWAFIAAETLCELPEPNQESAPEP